MSIGTGGEWGKTIYQERTGGRSCSLEVITCLHSEGDGVPGIIPFPVLEIHIKVEGLASPYYLFVSAEEMSVMVFAVVRTVQVDICQCNSCRKREE